jgi:hypothetical protein
MRFPELLQEFHRMQDRVTGLIADVEHLRRKLQEITPADAEVRSLVSRETESLPTEIAGG